MSEAAVNEAPSDLDRWLRGGWNPHQQAVITVAEVLAYQADKRRPWWRRRKSTPLHFVPAARQAVTALLVAGWRPPDSATPAPPDPEGAQ